MPVAEDSKRYTAFVTTEGQYEFNKMPFGLVNAPSAPNDPRLIQIVTNKIGSGTVVAYMDDMLVPSKTVTEGLEKLRGVLSVIRDLGLTLKLKKCKFLCTSLDYLGFEINGSGVRPGKRKTDAVINFERPMSVHEVSQF